MFLSLSQTRIHSLIQDNCSRKALLTQVVYSHFQSDERHRNCQIEDMLRFQIIEKIRTDNIANRDDALIRKRRLERELF